MFQRNWIFLSKKITYSHLRRLPSFVEGLPLGLSNIKVLQLLILWHLEIQESRSRRQTAPVQNSRQRNTKVGRPDNCLQITEGFYTFPLLSSRRMKAPFGKWRRNLTAVFLLSSRQICVRVLFYCYFSHIWQAGVAFNTNVLCTGWNWISSQ